MTPSNVHPLRRPTTPKRAVPEHIDLLRDFDPLTADIALDNPDLEPPGAHAAIRVLRNRYRTWLAHQAGHPSTSGGRDDGGAA